MSEAGRDLLSIDFEQGKFNFRVVCVAMRDDYVLVCRDEDDDYVMMPGGRAEYGESSLIALEREIDEEIQVPAKIGRLLFVTESLYRIGKDEHHELGFYYQVTLPDDFPFTTDGVCLETVETDEGKRLRFYWVKARPEELKNIALYPTWIHNALIPLPQTTLHMVTDDR